MIHITQPYNLKDLKPIIENEQYAVYTLGQINDNLWKAVRLNKKTGEQIDVHLQKKPDVRVVTVFNKNNTQNFR